MPVADTAYCATPLCSDELAERVDRLDDRHGSPAQFGACDVERRREQRIANRIHKMPAAAS